MNKNNKYNNIRLILGTIIFSLLIVSCDTDTTPSIYRDLPDNPAPVITSISPADSGLAGITEVTITGQNFSTDPSKNIVYFNELIADIIQVSETQFVVKAPNLVQDSVEIKIAVQGVALFSETFYLDLKAPTFEIYPFQDFEIPYGITTDNSNNVFFNLVLNGVSAGINTISPSANLEEFAPKGGESFYTDLKYAANGKVYGTRNPPVRAVFGSELGIAPKAIAMSDQTAKLLSLDIDNNNNIWVGGNGGNIYRITSDEVDKKSFAFEQSIQSLRYFNGYLYAAAKMDSVQSIWRMQVINSDSLGPVEEYFNISANLPGYTVNTITFSEDSKLFMGTSAIGNDPNSLVYLTQDKSLLQWYPGVVSGPILSFAWGSDISLYYVRQKVEGTQQQMIIRINMGILGAPYFGRD